MVTVTEHRIALTCGENRYLEAGNGPPLLLLHGMGIATSANSHDLLIPHLATRFRVLAPDLLGFGLGTRQVQAGPTFAWAWRGCIWSATAWAAGWAACWPTRARSVCSVW